MNEREMTEERSDQKIDVAQNREAVTSVKRTLAEQLSDILASWEILSKDELRKWLTSIHDELVGNSGVASGTESADPSTNAGSVVHTPPPTLTSFKTGSGCEETGVSYPFNAGPAVPAALGPANSNMTGERRKSKEISDVPQYIEVVNAMEDGDVKAKTKVAYYKLTGLGGVEVDEDEAVVLLEEGAKDGDSEAKWILGLCYEYGIGIEQDIERAELLYEQSSEDGNVVGKFLLENAEGGRGSGVMTVKSL